LTNINNFDIITPLKQTRDKKMRDKTDPEVTTWVYQHLVTGLYLKIVSEPLDNNKIIWVSDITNASTGGLLTPTLHKVMKQTKKIRLRIIYQQY
jgi:isopenicillin N synthase-like dioxygenase